MGFLSTIVAHSLDTFKDTFIQNTDILVFEGMAFVSWSTTPEQPKDNDDWYWLADNTLRIAKGERFDEKPKKYTTYPVECWSGNRQIYRWDLIRKSSHTLVHLALPAGYIADIPSLRTNMPSYTKFNRGRVCLGWLPQADDSSEYTCELIAVKPEQFEDEAKLFPERFDIAKRQQPDEKRIKHEFELMRIYSYRVQKLQEKVAMFGTINVPVHIQYELDEALAGLEQSQSIISQLR